jgi:hypothetical protein
MPKATPPVTNFTAGEWSPRLYGRADIDRYGQACSELQNMTLMPHGPVTRRMGTHYVMPAVSASSRLIEFIYNTEQAYVLEFAPGIIRFFRDGGYLDGHDIESPYTAADIAVLNYCQAADLMYLVCPRVAPQKLTRPGADTFALGAVSFTSSPEDWTANNWPSCATFFQQRLWFAGCPSKPQKIWASRTGDFENFTTATEAEEEDDEGDDASLSLSLVSEQVNAVRWLLAQKVLVAGTSGGEWVLSGGETALTPKNLSARLNSNYGCSPVRPLLIGSASSHVSADARRLMSFAYDFSADSYLSHDLSLLAEHMTRPGVKATANCQNPDGIIWCVMADGSAAGCTWLKDQEVIGWHRYVTDGKLLSVACIPEDGYTATWLIVQRGGNVVIERMAPPWDGETTNDPACFFVDCGLVYEGPPASHISGLDHLEGREVNILADGAEHPRRTVTGGAVDLDFAASVAVIGLPYEWRVTPMRLEGLSPLGTMQGKPALITEMTVRLYKTLGLHWRLIAAGKSYEASFRESAGPMDAPPAPYTGDVILAMPGGWHADTRVRLWGDGALPATVLMMIPTAAINK